MGNYDAVARNYVRAMQDNSAWQKMNVQEKLEQVERYVEGVMQAQRKASRKARGHQTARTIAEISNILSQPTKFSPEILDDLTGHGKNFDLTALMWSDYYLLENSGIPISCKAPKSPTVVRIASLNDLRLDATAIKPAEVVDDVAKQASKFDWKKFGKYGTITVAVASALYCGYKLIKNWLDKKEEVKEQRQEEARQSAIERLREETELPINVADSTKVGTDGTGVITGLADSINEDTAQTVEVADSISVDSAALRQSVDSGALNRQLDSLAVVEDGAFQQVSDEEKTVEEPKPAEELKPAEEVKPAEDAKPVEEEKPSEDAKPVEEEKPAEDAKPVQVNLQLDEDGKYTVKRGDSFWKIAERYLKDKYQNEPDKFANLTKQQKNTKIYNETMRIMRLNGYKLDKNKWYSDPMLHPNVKIKFEASLDQAA